MISLTPLSCNSLSKDRVINKDFLALVTATYNRLYSASSNFLLSTNKPHELIVIQLQGQSYNAFLQDKKITVFVHRL